MYQVRKALSQSSLFNNWVKKSKSLIFHKETCFQLFFCCSLLKLFEVALNYSFQCINVAGKTQHTSNLTCINCLHRDTVLTCPNLPSFYLFLFLLIKFSRILLNHDQSQLIWQVPESLNQTLWKQNQMKSNVTSHI